VKNLPWILGGLLVTAGVLFTLATAGSQDNNNLAENLANPQNSNQETKVDKKTYSAAPTVLPENERVGKKARFETSQGTFIVGLFGDKAPKTVSNFIFLAKEGFYNDLTFHRVIADFMIQGGDPVGNGTGGPGYQFEDEFEPSLTFSKPGLLAMANAGPSTNSSQFFITVSNPSHLNNRHTIFGEVVEGYEVVEKISKVEADSSDKPLNAVTIKKIEII